MNPESTPQIHALSTPNNEGIHKKLYFFFFFQQILFLNQVVSAVDQSSSYLTSLKENSDLGFSRNKL